MPRINRYPLFIQFFGFAGLFFIIVYLIAGLFANTASAYYPEIVLMFIPNAWHDRMLWDVMFLELIPLWISIGTLAVVWVGWKWDVFRFRG